MGRSGFGGPIPRTVHSLSPSGDHNNPLIFHGELVRHVDRSWHRVDLTLAMDAPRIDLYPHRPTTRSLVGQDALVEERVFFEYSNLLLEKAVAADLAKKSGFL